MIELFVVLAFAVLLVVPGLFGVDSRDGRDSQARQNQGWGGPSH
ncbi:MAG TPA: hypothetical protein VN193_16865 [Candidatus Angelobacter sp.]|jgi:hypothetical protein|nr:hypothetical protein [Candidatus Angelobacter sp.]